ncbi:MAG: L-amino acid N-acyltransferase YncA [Paracoccaceae bacterium]|jgi:L-amino acid N-acyltransferase YncA|uniref:GNAT family N-acetyltransferase n=1 Tax=Sulfitobacter sp. TaxID=1903071 RepID=UPI0039E54443
MACVRDSRLADMADVAAIANETLTNPFISWRSRPLSKLDIAAWREDGQDQKDLFRVVEANSKVVGFATLGPFKLESGFEQTKELSIYVASCARGSGIGKILMKDALQPQVGVRKIISAIDASNEGSVRLHEQFGFEQVGYLPSVGFTADEPRDLILMMYSLNSD